MTAARYDRPVRPGPAEPPLTLFDTAPLFVTPARATTIEGAFEAFHEANPWVYDALVRLTRDMVRRGHSKVGIGMLFEVVRWQWYGTTEDAHSVFRLNNNHRSRYSRRIMDNEPDLTDVFETRTLTSP